MLNDISLDFFGKSRTLWFMVINEIFYSLQGEGRLSGVPSVFVRLAGCPLRCRWCDTAYAQNASAGTKYSPEWLEEQIRSYPTSNIVITGGEPMVNPKLPELVRVLHRLGLHLTIETAGITFVPDLPCDLMSISPKLSNSTPTDPALAKVHEKARFNLPALRQLMQAYRYQLKFVVDTAEDLDEIVQVVGQLGSVNPQDVFLMPQAITRKEYLEKSSWLANYCLQTGFSYGHRLHVLLWPGIKGK